MEQGEQPNLHPAQDIRCMLLMIAVTQERKGFLREKFLLVVENTSAFCVYAASWPMVGYGGK